MGFELILGEITLDYSIQSLASAHIERINIGVGNLNLNRVTNGQKQPVPQKQTSIVSWPPIESLSIPFNQFTIDTLTVTQKLTQSWPEIFNLQLNLQHQTEQIILESTLSENDLPNLNLTTKLGITPDRTLHADISSSGAGSIVQHVSQLSTSGKRQLLSGESLLNTVELIDWLEAWTNISIKGLKDLKHTQPVQINHRLNWPKPGEYDFSSWFNQAQPTVSVISRGEMLPTASLKSIHWDLSAELVIRDQLTLHINDPSHVTLTTILPQSVFSDIVASEARMRIEPQHFKVTTELKNPTEFTTAGSITAEISDDSKRTSGILTLDSVHLALTPEITATSHVALNLHNSQTTTTDDLSMSPWQSELSADIHYSLDKIDVTLHPTNILSLTHAKIDGLMIENLTVDSGTSSLTIFNDAHIQSQSPWPISISFDEFWFEDLHLRKVNTTALLSHWAWLEERISGFLEINIPAVSGSWDKLTLPHLAINSTFKLDHQHAILTLNGTSLDEDLSFLLQSELVDLSPLHAQFQMSWPNMAKSHYLLRLLQQSDPHAEIISGNLNLASQYQATDNANHPALSLSVNAQDITLVYDQILMEQMNISGELNNLFSNQQNETIKIDLPLFNPGVPITNLSVHALPTVEIENDFLFDIWIEQATANLLGGRILIEPFNWTPARASIEILTKFERFELERIISLVSQPGLSGSGQLDGFLPITLDSQGLHMEAGKIWARKPGGVLRYQSNVAADQMAAANPLMQITLDALSNYHYDELTADVDYNYHGDLTLAARLNGRNPDFNRGQKINLNINLEDNIPTLLKSLRVAQDINSMIGDQVNVESH